MAGSWLVPWLIGSSLVVLAACGIAFTLRACSTLRAVEEFVKRSGNDLGRLTERAEDSMASVEQAVVEARDLVEDARKSIQRADSVLNTAENVALNVRLTTVLMQRSLAPSLISLSGVAAGVRKGLQVVRKIRGR